MTETKKPELINLEFYSDDRGFLVPLTNSLEEGLSKEIKRTYIVGNFSKGVIRGLHFHKKEIKLFSIVRGAAKFVAINPESPEKDLHIFTLSDKKPMLLMIPPGYANGWISLADNTLLVALSTATFQESVKDDTRYDPYKWGDFWGIKAR